MAAYSPSSKSSSSTLMMDYSAAHNLLVLPLTTTTSPDAPPVIASHHREPLAVGGRPPPPLSFSGSGGGKSTTPALGSRATSRVMTKESGEHVGCVHVFMMQGGGNRRSNTNTRDSRSPDHDASDVKPFILDSGATVHATGDRTVFSYLQATRTTRSLRMANGSLARISGWGTVRHHNITLHGVLYVPELAHNIVSVSKLGELDYIVEFRRTSCFIREAATGDLVGEPGRDSSSMACSS